MGGKPSKPRWYRDEPYPKQKPCVSMRSTGTPDTVLISTANSSPDHRAESFRSTLRGKAGGSLPSAADSGSPSESDSTEPNAPDTKESRQLGATGPLSAVAHRENVEAVKGVVACSWGWGGEGRTGRGTFTYGELSPHLVADTTHASFIDIAAGKRHSLFVTNQGLVYTTGEGRAQQLGKVPTSTSLQLVFMRRCPNAALPSGKLRYGRDLQIAQVQAGAFTSFAREIAEDDACRSVDGFVAAERQIEALLKRHSDNAGLLQLYAHLREERARLARRCKGQVLAWGESRYGQLGLGKGVFRISRPTVISRLSRKRVRCIAAGKEHTLAATYQGQVYAWGRGKHGRLGLGDFDDRWLPTRVSTLDDIEGRVMEFIGAGASHSIVIVRGHSGIYIPYTWGKGANGRLGDGRNLNRSLPVAVRHMPPSLQQKDWQLLGLAVGGAHNLLLYQRTSQRGMSDPMGVQSRVYAWGCNSGGQLGLNDAVDRALPQRVWIPESEHLTSIGAGRAHSAALTRDGRMYTWGRGMWGQLGQGNEDLRYRATEVGGTKFWLKVVGGECHSLGLIYKPMGPRRRLLTSLNKQDSEQVCPLKLSGIQSAVLSTWSCARRVREDKSIEGAERAMRVYRCLTCALDYVCQTCALKCHAAHNIDLCQGIKRKLCQCGLRPQACLIMPHIKEEDSEREQYLALLIQPLVRGHLIRKAFWKLNLRRRSIRKRGCQLFWQEQVIKPIFDRIQRLYKQRRIEIELATMQLEEQRTRRAVRYRQQTESFRILHAQKLALDKLLRSQGRSWQPSRTALLRLGRLIKAHNYDFSAITFRSRQHFRQALRHLPLILHPPYLELLDLTRGLPAFGFCTPYDLTTDSDLAKLFDCLEHEQVQISSRREWRRRRSATLAAPEGLYQRLCYFRPQCKLKKQVRRRQHSFDRGHLVDKSFSSLDCEREILSRERCRQIQHSNTHLYATDILKQSADNLGNPTHLLTRRGIRDYVYFTQSYAAPGIDRDTQAVLRSQQARAVKRAKSITQTDYASSLPPHVMQPPSTASQYKLEGLTAAPRRRRIHSIAASERLAASIGCWIRNQARENAIQAAAIQQHYPTRRPSWIWRMDKVDPSMRVQAEEEMDSYDWAREMEQIAIVAECNGWDLDMHSPGFSHDASDESGMTHGKSWKDTTSQKLAARRDSTALVISSGSEEQYTQWLPKYVRQASISQPWSNFAAAKKAESCPYQWTRIEDHGQIYFYNQETGVSEWELPANVLHKVATTAK